MEQWVLKSVCALVLKYLLGSPIYRVLCDDYCGIDYPQHISYSQNEQMPLGGEPLVLLSPASQASAFPSN